MSTQILEKLAEPDNVIKIASDMSSSSFKDENGVQVIDVMVCESTTVPRFGAYGPEGQWIGEYDLKLVLNGPENIDDERLKRGINLIDTHNQSSALKIYGKTFPGDKGGWRIENGKLFLRAKLGEIAKIAGITADVRDGIIDKVSLGFYTLKSTWDLTGARPLQEVSLIQPFEFSLCSNQAIPNAVILSSQENPMTTKANPTVAAPVAAVAAPVVPAAPAVTAPAPTAEQLAALAAAAATTTVPAAPAAPVVLAANDPRIASIMLGAQTLGVYARADARRVVGGTVEQIMQEIQRACDERAAVALSRGTADNITPSLALPPQTPEKTESKETLAAPKTPWWAEALTERSELRKSLGLVG